MSVSQKFLSKILMGWRAHKYPIFQRLSRIILKYSYFIFYVATTKNNKFDFGPYLKQVQHVTFRAINFIVKVKCLACQFFRKTSVFQKRTQRVPIISPFACYKKKLPYTLPACSALPAPLSVAFFSSFLCAACAALPTPL